MKLHKIALLAIFALGLVGCGGGTDLADETAREVGVCFGRVVDRSARSGIADATVELFGGALSSDKDNTSNVKGKETNFVAKAKTGADDADTTLFNEAGMWKIAGVPTGETDTGYRVRIAATGYATVQTNCLFSGGGVAPSRDNTPIAEDLGDILLPRGVDVTVNLSNNGAVVASCPVFAVPGASAEPAGSAGQGTTVLAGVEVSGTTDTSGQATLAGLNPFIAYTIVAPACDSDGDNIYDTHTATFAVDSFIDSNLQINIAVHSSARDDAIALVDTNATLITDTSAAGAGFAFSSLVDTVFGEGGGGAVFGTDDLLSMGKAANLVLVFNYPVAIASAPGIGFDFTNNLVTLTGVTGFPLPSTVDATCTLSANSTVLTCDPASDLVNNEIYFVTGSVTASEPDNVNASVANEVLNLSDLDDDGTLDGGLYIFVDSAWSDTASPTADNYNATNAGGAGNSDLVYLEFPEFVYGTWEVISTTSGTVATTLVGVGCRGNLHTTASFLFEGNDPDTAGVLTGSASDATTLATGSAEAAGCASTSSCPGTAVRYRVPLTAAAGTCSAGGDLNLTDHLTATPQTVTVFIDATDVDGNRRQGEFALSIQ